jgi:hypothetical protein
MGAVKNFFRKFRILGELFGFLWHNKLWWMIPLFVILVIVGIVLIFGESSAIGPFIYSLF